MIKKLALFSVILTAVLVSFVQAVEIQAVRVVDSPKIDGLLSEPVWLTALPFSGFLMVEPQPNQDPSEKTELRILYDEANLYIGVLCYDSEPGRIAANSLAHDSGGGQSHGMGYGHMPQAASDDVLRVLLDPFQDKRTAYTFFINPRGARGEGLTSGGEASLNWDGIWDAKSRISGQRLERRAQDPLQNPVLQARAHRLGHQRRTQHRPQAGDHTDVRNKPGQ